MLCDPTLGVREEEEVGIGPPSLYETLILLRVAVAGVLLGGSSSNVRLTDYYFHFHSMIC